MINNWKNEVNLYDILKQYDEDQDITKAVNATVETLKSVKPLKSASKSQKEQFDDIISDFEVAETEDDFNYFLDKLYDLSDNDKLLLINASFPQTQIQN